MPASKSASSNRSNPQQNRYICYMCSKTFDSIETLDSHKRLEHSEPGRPQSLAGVG